MKQTEIRFALEEQAAQRDVSLGMRRDALAQIPVERDFATILTGARRSGKSTLLNQWAHEAREKTVSVMFDDIRLANFEFSDFKALDAALDDLNVRNVILDEVQEVTGWERYVASLLLRRRRVLVTGSNAKMLSRELGTKLTGRHLNMEVFPFSFSEFARFTKRKPSPAVLDDYLNVGGFPAYVRDRSPRILRELFTDILYRDVIVRYGLTDTAPIKRLATFLLAHAGCLVTPSRLKDSIRVQQAKTVLEYFDHLTECYLICRMERFADSAKARLQAPKKIYACDTGLVGAVESGHADNRGHKLENVLFWHLRQRGGDLTYFHDTDSGTECDFLREADDGSFEAVQATWTLSDENEEWETTGLLKAMRRFGLKEGVIVTRDQTDLITEGGSTIRIVPAHEFLTLG